MTQRPSYPFPWRSVSVGVVLYLTLQVLCVGVARIAGSSEAREAQVVDVMTREGSWILPLRNGLIPSKPPLYHWLAAGVSEVTGGVSEFSVRLTSHLAALWCLVLVALIAYRGARLLRTFQGPGHARRSALIAAGILSLTYGFYQMGCQAMVDMTFAACVWGALGAIVLGITHQGGGNYSLTSLGRGSFWLFCSLGILARGPVGCVLPVFLAAVLGVSIAGWRRTLREFVRPNWGWLAFSIPMAWYFAAYERGGSAFLERQIFFENLQRFSGGDFVNSESWWFYLPSLARTTFPWGVVLVMLLLKELGKKVTVSYPLERSLTRWSPMLVLSAGVLLFSLSSGKRHSYMLPLLPCIAIQLGWELSTLLERGGVRARTRLVNLGRVVELWLTGIALVLVGGVSVAISAGIVSDQYITDAYAAAAPILSRITPIILIAALVVFVSIRRELSALYASVWFLMLAVMTAVVTSGAATKAYFKGFDAMSATWLATVAEGDELAVFKNRFDEYFDPILFYVRRPVRLVALEEVAQECQPRTVYAARRSWLDAHEQVFAGVVVRIVTIRERLQAQKESSERDLVLFRCSTLGLRAPGRHEQPILQDAKFSISD